MLDWIFGSSKKEEKKSEKSKVVIPEEDLWAYDFVKQYLVSPIWRNPLLDFIEENCLIFQDTEENKFEYTNIHKSFMELCAQMLESITKQTGISEGLLELCIIKGISDKNDYKIFSQVLLCDNFLSFKKVMVAKNKELEMAALKMAGLKQTAAQAQIDEKELERLQIEKAIAMSLAYQEKLKEQEDKELEEAIRASQAEASQKKMEEPKSKLGDLPPLMIGGNRGARPINEFKEEETKLVKEIETLKINNKPEGPAEDAEERKKRLLEQRELIKKKKMQERKEELNAYVENKQQPVNTGGEQPKVSEEELEKRRKLMQKLKAQLKD